MREDEEPRFAAPWEASAFGLRAYLVERGVLDPTDFSTLLGEELRAGHTAADDGTAYFVAFVTALERAIADIAPHDRLAAERAAWRHAAHATPHGKPIVLPRQKP